MSRNILNNWLWTQAEQKAAEPSSKPVLGDMGFAILPHLRRDRVKAAYIQRGKFGGYIGDIAFRDMPVGFPDMMGTAISNPVKSEDDARQTVISLLALVIWAEQMDHTANPGKPLFEFHDLTVSLSTEAMQGINEHFPVKSADLCDLSRGRLADMEQLFDGDYSAKKVASFDKKTECMFLAVIHNARHQGITRWPETQGASPSCHEPVSAMVH